MMWRFSLDSSPFSSFSFNAVSQRKVCANPHRAVTCVLSVTQAVIVLQFNLVLKKVFVLSALECKEK